MNNLSRNFARLVWHGRWIVVLLAMVTVLAMTSGARLITFTNDYRYFFSEDNPNLADWELIQRTYTKNDQLLWVIRPKEGEAITPRTLKIVGEITDLAWETPFSTRVDSLTNFQHTQAEEDDLLVGDLVPDPANVTDEEASRIRDVAVNDPILYLRLVSRDVRTTAVFATMQMPQDDNKALSAVMTHARAIKSSFSEKYPDHEFALTGSVALSNAFSEAAPRDMSTLVPIMLLVITGVVFFLSRSVTGTLATVVVVLLSSASAMGLAGWLGIRISPPSSMSPIVILTVAVADAIHILMSTMIFLRDGLSKKDAIAESLRINMGPVFLTSLTTAIGFLSLQFSDAPPIRDLGVIAAMGAMIAWLLSITLFPALLAILPIKAGKMIERQSSFAKAISRPVIALRVPIALLFGTLIVLSVLRVPVLEFNDRFVEYFDDRIEFRRDSDFAAENLTGIYVLNYSIEAAESGGISDPEYLANLDAFALWLRAQPEVTHVASFTDVMKRINKSMHGDDPGYYQIPRERNLAAQYLLLYEMSLPYGLDLNDQINVDKSATRLVVTLDDISTANLGLMCKRANDWQEANLPDFMRASPAGQVVMFSFIGINNFNAMKLGTGVAIVLISLCLVIALRNIKLGLVSLVPNITPPLLAFAVFSLFIQEIGFWSTFVIAAALGLIVDATVHFLSKYRRGEVEHGLDAKGAVQYAFEKVGTPLFVSTAVLIAGFSILSLSSFRVNAMLGITVALTIAVALIVDFLLLPALLVFFDRSNKSKVRN